MSFVYTHFEKIFRSFVLFFVKFTINNTLAETLNWFHGRKLINDFFWARYIFRLFRNCTHVIPRAAASTVSSVSVNDIVRIAWYKYTRLLNKTSTRRRLETRFSLSNSISSFWLTDIDEAKASAKIGDRALSHRCPARANTLLLRAITENACDYCASCYEAATSKDAGRIQWIRACRSLMWFLL